MREVTLGSLVQRNIGYGIVQPGESVLGGVPVVKVKDIISRLRSVRELDTTSREIDSKYARSRLQGGELLISVVGTPGRTCIVPIDFKGCNVARAVAIIDIADKALSLWVKYFLDSPTAQNYIKSELNTTVQPTLNIKSLVNMTIPIPDHETINRIVGLLSSIDAKIGINERINDNLSA